MCSIDFRLDSWKQRKFRLQFLFFDYSQYDITTKIVFETDSFILMKALKSQDFDQAVGGMMFREARFQIRIIFISVDILHCSRDCNKCGRELTHPALHWDVDEDESHNWLDPTSHRTRAMGTHDRHSYLFKPSNHSFVILPSSLSNIMFLKHESRVHRSWRTFHPPPDSFVPPASHRTSL